MFRIPISRMILVMLAAVIASVEAQAPAIPPGLELQLYADLSTPAIAFKTTGKYTSGPEYAANNDMVGGLTVRYKEYSASVGSPLFGTSRFDPARPPTRFFDLKLAWLDDHWGVEGYAQYFRGFYVTPAKSETVLMDNPGAALRSANINVYRGIGSRSQVYRLRDGLTETGLDVNFYGVFGVSRQSLRSPIPFLDSSSGGEGTAFESMTRFSYTGATAGPGLAVNLNLGGFFIDPTLMMAFGVQSYQANGARESNEWGGLTKVNLGLRTGYETDSWILGMSADGDGNGADLRDNIGLLFHSTVVRFFLGLMF
jgi:hypothetical protein